MSDFFDKLRGQIDASLTKVTTKSRVTLETTRLNAQIRRITREKEDALARLGAHVYQDLAQGKPLNHQGIEAEVKRIAELDSSIVELQQEIRRLEALDAATPWSTGEAEKPIATCTCGALLTEETRFCTNCGSNTREIIAKVKAEQHAQAEATKGTTALCSQCRAEVPASAKFCRHCGATLAGKPDAADPQTDFRCPHCDNEINPTARFCRHCGKLVLKAPTSQPEEVPVQAKISAEPESQPVGDLQDALSHKRETSYERQDDTSIPILPKEGRTP